MSADTDHLNARAVAAWSAACLVVVLATTNPVYKTLVLAAALAALVAGAGFRRTSRLFAAAALNLVPAVGATFVQVSEAQRMRGWRPRGPRSWAEVAVPVVLTSVESSIQLAESMEARGFGSGPRTHMSPVRMSSQGWVLVVASGSAVALFTLSIAAGWAGPWAPYPLLTAPPIDPRPLLACLLLFTPALQWRSRS